MSISNRPLQPQAHSSSIHLLIIIIIIILDDTDQHTRSRGIARGRERERERERERVCVYTIVYKSLDVRYTPYVSTITDFVSETTLEHVVPFPLVSVVTWSRQRALLGWIIYIVINAPTLAWNISIVIKSILKDWLMGNPRWRQFSKKATT